MSRASELTLFLIILQASIGFVDATGMFTEHYISVPQNNANYTLNDLSPYATVQNGGIVDELILAAHWAIEALLIGIKVIFTVIFVYPTLVTAFNIPIALSVFIQAGIYYVYAVFYAQFKSGKGWRLYE
jgi:hypothetical protein